jgi:hypothetical protein
MSISTQAVRAAIGLFVLFAVPVLAGAQSTGNDPQAQQPQAPAVAAALIVCTSQPANASSAPPTRRLEYPRAIDRSRPLPARQDLGLRRQGHLGV